MPQIPTILESSAITAQPRVSLLTLLISNPLFNNFTKSFQSTSLMLKFS